MGTALPSQAKVRITIRKFVEGERGDAEAGFGAVEVGDDGVGQEFGVAGAEFNVFEHELHDRGQTLRHFVAVRRHGRR